METDNLEKYMCEGMVMSKLFPATSLDKIKIFDYRDDDILVITYPKAGKWPGIYM